MSTEDTSSKKDVSNGAFGAAMLSTDDNFSDDASSV